MAQNKLTPREKYNVTLAEFSDLTNDHIDNIIHRTLIKVDLLNKNRMRVRNFIREYRLYTPYAAGMSAVEFYQYIEKEIEKEKDNLLRFKKWKQEQDRSLTLTVS